MTSTSRFAFYGRVSTEDQQDPVASKGWQFARATTLVQPHGGSIVAEYFDIGQSRSKPWPRRPESARLLEDLRRPDRGFDAVVIGEPARAFYGNQFGLTFPLFNHFKVELWVPEVSGRVDPGSDAHDMVMSLYGGMSKGERNRIKIRVRAAMADQAHREGRFLGGRPPYGYRLVDAGPHPNPGKAADGKRLHQLDADPVTAPITRRIFEEYLAGRGLYAIAEGLTRDGVPSPSAHDRERNRHRDARAWSKSAVRAILGNPRYTGRQVWNRQRRDEVLVNIEDVALGHETKMRWNDRADWVWLIGETHTPLVSPEVFARAQEVAKTGARRPTPAKGRTTRRRYALSGLIWCGLCGRRMQGQHNHDAPHYRCRFAADYALANKVDHPRTVYVREAPVVAGLDAWLADVLSPDRIDETCDGLARAGEADEALIARAEGARRKVADCDHRLQKYRAVLEAGADPRTVAQWMAEAKAERLDAEREVARCRPTGQLSAADWKALLDDGLGDLVVILKAADDDARAKLYGELGLRLTYYPAERTVRSELWLPACATERVGGGT